MGQGEKREKWSGKEKWRAQGRRKRKKGVRILNPK